MSKIDPIVFECDMSIVAIKWNHNGNVLALVGSLIVDGDVKESNVLQLYSPFGEVSLKGFDCKQNVLQTFSDVKR